MRAVRSALQVTLLSLGMIASPALAAPKITEIVQNYTVSGVTSGALRREFRARGMKGFTGFTQWEVRWTPECEVSVTVTYTLPKHSDPLSMPRKLRNTYFRMLANLYLHEQMHGRHGIKAAREISRARCQNAAAIVKKYNKADKDLDRRTGHGRTDGVVLN